MLDPIVPQPPAQPPARRANARAGPAAPATTDLAERMIAFQRRTAQTSRTRERAERPPPAREVVPERAQQLPQPTSSRDRLPSSSRSPVLSSPQRRPVATAASPRADVGVNLAVSADDFSRRLRLTDTTRSTGRTAPTDARRLFDPNGDSIHARRTAEPEVMSDAASSSNVHGRSPPGAKAAPTRDAASGHRQLFDHRKDDPVRFSVLARPGAAPGGRPVPTPKSSMDYSASSNSSYAPSFASSNFTLSSDTTGSSVGSGHEGSRPPEDPGSANAFSAQLKRLYRAITALEAKIINDDAAENNEDVRRVLKGGPQKPMNEEAERERWARTIADHKRLADMMHNLLEISLAPSVPASLRNIPEKYNIIPRLWTNSFHKLLEGLRRSACASDQAAFEHLQDFLYYAYSFYTGLLEERNLDAFRSNWIEALGDLARYGMAVSAMVNNQTITGQTLPLAEIRHATGADVASSKPSKSGSVNSELPAARIDDSPLPSIGLAAARALEVEPEKERWRQIAREWYFAGVAAKPGAGKLHHHIGLLSRDIDIEELRGVYHFTKSLTALHPFPTSRESVLSLWSIKEQTRRQQPDARASELFVLLHGMLFTNIQLDDFQPTLARFLERLEIEGAEEREWIMMGVVNISAVLEYGKATGVVRRTGGTGARDSSTATVQGGPKVRVASRRDDDAEKMDVDEAPVLVSIQSSPKASTTGVTAEDELPMAFQLALQLTFTMLELTLRKPTRKSSPFARSTLNAYNTVLLTFLATVAKHPATLAVLERAVPWAALAAFMTAVPRSAMAQVDGAVMLTSGAQPLDEDWCMRGMEWVARRVYERGFWKAGDERKVELEVLERAEGGADEAATDGIIEDENEDGPGASTMHGSRGTSRRWVRLARASVGLARVVDGLEKVEGSREWRVEGVLAEKVARWDAEDRAAREEEERRRTRRRWDEDEMMVDDDGAEGTEESEDDDEDDSEEVKALKARRRYLRNLQRGGEVESPVPRPPRARGARKAANATGPSVRLVPGYSVLVVDTNVLLSSLSMVASLVESVRWTVVVPLPVVMELDGLSANANELGEAAAAALTYVSAGLRTHARSLKVQTSKGNYLSSLSVRTEQVDFDGDWERNMDDLILRAAIWQDEHWVDRSALLLGGGDAPAETKGAAKVVLLSFDRNLRLKARSRQLAAANEKDLAAVLAGAT